MKNSLAFKPQVEVMAQRVKAARKQAGLTQVELAKQVGCVSTHISHLENAKAMGSFSLYDKIAEACDVTFRFHIDLYNG